LERDRCWRATGQDQLWCHRDQFRGEGPHAAAVATGPTIVDLDIATIHPSKLAELSSERRNLGLKYRITFSVHGQHADPPPPLGLLRPRRQRLGRRRAAEHSDEFAP